jgi:peptidoglycan/LPS O-acetylase OafA/YrhL
VLPVHVDLHVVNALRAQLAPDRLLEDAEHLAVARFVGDVVTLIGEFALLYLVATISWKVFEQPILRLKKKFEAEGKVAPVSSSVEPEEALAKV